MGCWWGRARHTRDSAPTRGDPVVSVVFGGQGLGGDVGRPRKPEEGRVGREGQMRDWTSRSRQPLCPRHSKEQSRRAQGRRLRTVASLRQARAASRPLPSLPQSWYPVAIATCGLPALGPGWWWWADGWTVASRQIEQKQCGWDRRPGSPRRDAGL